MLWQGHWGYITGRGALEPAATVVASITLSSSTIAEDAVIGAVIGALAVTGGTGSYTFSLTSNPGGLFGISGSSLTVAAILSAGSKPITVQASGGTPSPVTHSFMITVTLVTTTTTIGEMKLGPWHVTMDRTLINAGEP